MLLRQGLLQLDRKPIQNSLISNIRRRVVLVWEKLWSPEQFFRLSLFVTCLSAGSFAGAGGAEADCTQRVSGVFPDRKGNSFTWWFDLIITQHIYINNNFIDAQLVQNNYSQDC